ncbi:MAG TPA: hypothetical protein VNG90_02315 [Candidatus Acidoferrum sp.]|nr:hypothetical protein [Candidatus Acidoferrum sp.]
MTDRPQVEHLLIKEVFYFVWYNMDLIVVYSVCPDGKMSGTEADLEEWKAESPMWTNVRLRTFGTYAMILQAAIENMRAIAWTHARFGTKLQPEEAKAAYDAVKARVDKVWDRWYETNRALAWTKEIRVEDHLAYAKQATERAIRARRRCQALFEQAFPSLKDTEFWPPAVKNGFSSY